MVQYRDRPTQMVRAQKERVGSERKQVERLCRTQSKWLDTCRRFFPTHTQAENELSYKANFMVQYRDRPIQMVRAQEGRVRSGRNQVKRL